MNVENLNKSCLMFGENIGKKLDNAGVRIPNKLVEVMLIAFCGMEKEYPEILRLNKNDLLLSLNKYIALATDTIEMMKSEYVDPAFIKCLEISRDLHEDLIHRNKDGDVLPFDPEAIIKTYNETNWLIKSTFPKPLANAVNNLYFRTQNNEREIIQKCVKDCAKAKFELQDTVKNVVNNGMNLLAENVANKEKAQEEVAQKVAEVKKIAKETKKKVVENVAKKVVEAQSRQVATNKSKLNKRKGATHESGLEQ